MFEQDVHTTTTLQYNYTIVGISFEEYLENMHILIHTGKLL